MALKTYVLLEHTKSTAPIYHRVNADQRVLIDKRPIDSPYLRTTFVDENGKNRTARLKLTSNTIWQDEQIKEGIPANEPFTQAERDAVKFKWGVLMQDEPIVQQYLESIPHMEGFKGKSAEIKYPLYKVYDQGVQVDTDNADFLKRVEVANKIVRLSLEEGQALMIRINGSYFTPPETLKEVQNALVKFMDQTDNAGLDKMLQDEESVDDRMAVMIGRAITKGILSFDQEPGQVSKKLNNKWVPVKQINADMDRDQRLKIFSEFLTSKEGKALADDLAKEVAKK